MVASVGTWGRRSLADSPITRAVTTFISEGKSARTLESDEFDDVRTTLSVGRVDVAVGSAGLATAATETAAGLDVV